MIIFENPGEIDIRSICTFGVSVKEGENPIGFFGTGLKYAIAVLLRTGHKVTIQSGRTVANFGLSKETIRGQEFEVITMATGNGPAEHLGFTTQLGKQWELWMAYREVACNCKDEGGDGFHSTSEPAPIAGTTRVIVKGDAFEGVFDNGHMYILTDDPSMKLGMVEVRNRAGNDLFYRGVRVMQTNRPGLYTYNILSQISLTEDRTVKSEWDVYTNHPDTLHVCQDLQQADWTAVPSHDLLLASPACQGHSKARGKERAHHDAQRSTAWAVVDAVECHRPSAFTVENVPEFGKWVTTRLGMRKRW